LGVSRNASKAEVAQAFRKQMSIHHPDAQSASKSAAEKERATERAKLITEAYQKIKKSMR